MNELRWILLGIGVVLLALIYLFSRRAPEDADALPPGDRRLEPPLSLGESSAAEADTIAGRYDSQDDTIGMGEPRFAPAPAQTVEPVTRDEQPQNDTRVSEPESTSESRTEPEPENTAAPAVPEKVIALHLMPKTGEVFEGTEFIGAIQAEGLKFGRFDIFHRLADVESAGDKGPSLFSLANIIKPGTFNLHDLDQQQFKGASMFLVLPGPEDAVAAFADMLATGRRLAATLNGQLLDAQGTRLSRQSASHLREDIINYQHGLSATPAE